MSLLGFSIITPTLNRASMLTAALASVRDQHYPAYEHLVMDGGSTDATAEICRGYEHLSFFSGADEGMYDALNKGLRLAQGEIIGFLNSDDQYAADIFACVAEKFVDHEVHAVVGGALVFEESKDGERQIVGRFSPLTADLLECTTIGTNYFNAWFFRRSVFQEIGEFDARYRIAGDRDLLLRFVGSGLKYAMVDQVAYEYRDHPESFTFTVDLKNRQRAVDETIGMIDAYKRNRSLPPAMMEKLRLKHLYSTREMAIRFLKRRDLGKMMKYAWIGTRVNWRWPVEFVRAAMQKAPSRPAAQE